jgi:hypothetical protein
VFETKINKDLRYTTMISPEDKIFLRAKGINVATLIRNSVRELRLQEDNPLENPKHLRKNLERLQLLLDRVYKTMGLVSAEHPDLDIMNKFAQGLVNQEKKA